MKKEQLKNAHVTVRFVDKNLNFLNKVTRFDLKIPGLESIQIEGDKIDEGTYQKILRKTSQGDQLALFDIKMNVYDPRLKGAMCFLTTPLVVQIY
nr:hypothetical protein [Flavobacterium buctense]